jgi:hypothetical protein
MWLVWLEEQHFLERAPDNVSLSTSSIPLPCSIPECGLVCVRNINGSTCAPLKVASNCLAVSSGLSHSLLTENTLSEWSLSACTCLVVNHICDLSQGGSAALANVTPGVTYRRDQQSGRLSPFFIALRHFPQFFLSFLIFWLLIRHE